MSDYETFRDTIKDVLARAEKPLTWAEIREKGGFKQKVPNNKWVKRLEHDIGLVRERTDDNEILWRLDK